jgi:hypothetical protein
MKKTVLAGLVAGFSLLGMSNGALAAMDYDYSGTFAKDNDVVCFEFSVDTASEVTLFTSSWNTGGFDPLLTIWDSTGNYLFDWDDTMDGSPGSAESKSVSYAFSYYDVVYTDTFEPGSYIATITQYYNYANAAFDGSSTLADGFTYDDDPHYTHDVLAVGAYPDFNGFSSGGYAVHTTGDLDFHIVNVLSAQLKDCNSVPVPPSVLLLATSLAGLAGVGYRRKK